MAHHCIKYRLTAEGTIPSFLCLHEEGVGGVFVVGDPSTASPRDMVMVGLSEDDDIGDAELITTQSNLQTYLESVGEDWTTIDPENPDERLPFDATVAAEWVWQRKLALDA